MRIRRLIPIIVVLFILAATTMTTVQYSLVGVESGTASAQQSDDQSAQSNGLPSVKAAETKAELNTDLYLDADEVEKRAAAEQSGDSAATSTSRVPVSFKHVALPLRGGIDHAVAGVGTRNSGQGVIRLRGVPPGSTLLSAFLVWGEITNDPTAYKVRFGPDCTTDCTTPNVAGQVYGTTIQPCWNGAGVYAGYITSVTGQILPGINGDYRVCGLRSAITNNQCPWGDGNCAAPSNNLVLSEGASLVVIYSNPCIPRAAQLYINLGPIEFQGPHQVTHFTLPAINGNLPNLKHSRIGADGQVGWENCGLRAFTPTTDEKTWIENPVTGGSIQIKGDGGLNRDSDWNGYDGEPLNKLWDSHTDVFGSGAFLAAGGGLSYRVRYDPPFDCIVWAVHILGVR